MIIVNNTGCSVSIKLYPSTFKLETSPPSSYDVVLGAGEQHFVKTTELTTLQTVYISVEGAYTGWGFDCFPLQEGYILTDAETVRIEGARGNDSNEGVFADDIKMIRVNTDRKVSRWIKAVAIAIALAIVALGVWRSRL